MGPNTQGKGGVLFLLGSTLSNTLLVLLRAGASPTRKCRGFAEREEPTVIGRAYRNPESRVCIHEDGEGKEMVKSGLSALLLWREHHVIMSIMIIGT